MEELTELEQLQSQLLEMTLQRDQLRMALQIEKESHLRLEVRLKGLADEVQEMREQARERSRGLAVAPPGWTTEEAMAREG